VRVLKWEVENESRAILMDTDEALRKAEVLGSDLARRLQVEGPSSGFSEREWKVGIAFQVSNLVARSWFRLSGWSFHEDDDYSVVMEGRPVSVEVKGSMTERDPPWPVSKGMGGWQRERRRAAIIKGYSFTLLQVAVKADTSVKAAATQLTLGNVPEGRHTANYRRKVAYFLKDSSGEKMLKEILGEDWAPDEL
jgi:hypothetical protein